jgi:hypothetical protein
VGITLRATDSMLAPCDAWLDALDEVEESDLEVWYHPAPDPEEAKVRMPFVAELECSEVVFALSDGGPTHRDAGKSDAGKSDARATHRDAGKSPVHSLVDLETEGWYLERDSTGVRFQLCPNACFTFRQRGGSLGIDVYYDIRAPGAR